MLVLAGALLEHAEDLLRMGLSPSEVIEGYQLASQKALDILPGASHFYVLDILPGVSHFYVAQGEL